MLGPWKLQGSWDSSGWETVRFSSWESRVHNPAPSQCNHALQKLAEHAQRENKGQCRIPTSTPKELRTPRGLILKVSSGHKTSENPLQGRKGLCSSASQSDAASFCSFLFAASFRIY